MKFGAPTEDLSPPDFLFPDAVVQTGVEPNRIDFLTSLDGVEFGTAWPNRITADIEGIEVPVLGREDLIRNKKAVGRTKDLADIEKLERQDQGSDG